jgi:hypothetical protein
VAKHRTLKEETEFTVGSKVRVTDKNTEHYQQVGEVVRLGSAGEVLYIMVLFPGYITPRTFVHQQIELERV